MGAHPLVPPGVYAPLVVEWCVLEVDYDYVRFLRIVLELLRTRPARGSDVAGGAEKAGHVFNWAEMDHRVRVGVRGYF